MNNQQLITLARANGFLTGHFLKMKDLKSGTVIAGRFTKYKQYGTNNLRIKNDYAELDVIRRGELIFKILDSVNLETGIRIGDRVRKKSGKPFPDGSLTEVVKSFSVNPKDPEHRICAVFESGYCNVKMLIR